MTSNKRQRRLKIRKLLMTSLLVGLISSVASPNAEIFKDTISRAQFNILQETKEGAYWSFPAYLGTHYISQYYLMLHWIGRSAPDLNPAILRNLLLRSQLPDGSWQAVKEINSNTGDLNASIFNYWALKAMGVSIDSEALLQAKGFILRRGGLEKSSLLTRVFLCLFGNHSWKDISPIPFWFFSNSFPINSSLLAQWVSPHLMPIAYLRNRQLTKVLGERFELNELNLSARPPISSPGKPDLKRLGAFVEKIANDQQPHGSWGGYTLATLLTVAVLEDYRSFASVDGERYAPQIAKGYSFIDTLYFKSGESSYLGVTDDGKYWDTALLATALLESGLPSEKLKRTGEFLSSKQMPNGGFPFGIDFEYAPDTDDTAITILALDRMGGYPEVVKKASLWLEEMQNSDGGWGAFAKNNNGNFILAELLKPFSDSVEFFDKSSADVAGHVLEALGTLGQNSENSAVVTRAIEYLFSVQDHESGAWRGRWGVNYLYGTGAAVVGMVKAGVSAKHPSLQKALDWTESKQNGDGGFGESTLSYVNKDEMGKGKSTPSQTAWALIALVAGDRSHGAVARRAAQYLMTQMQLKGKWVDESSVGTGHPKIVYMQYPSYAYAFPLIALSRYANAKRD